MKSGYLYRKPRRPPPGDYWEWFGVLGFALMFVVIGFTKLAGG